MNNVASTSRGETATAALFNRIVDRLDRPGAGLGLGLGLDKTGLIRRKSSIINLPTYLSIHLSIYLSIYLSINLFIYQSIYQFICFASGVGDGEEEIFRTYWSRTKRSRNA